MLFRSYKNETTNEELSLITQSYHLIALRGFLTYLSRRNITSLAIDFAGHTDDVEIVQLNSFGCGLDAVTTDQVQEIASSHNKLYTVLKIDEGSNLGAAKIRIRSLKAAMEEREKNEIRHKKNGDKFERVVFEKSMRKDYTLLIPQMSPIHFQFLETALEKAGYKAKMLPPVDHGAIEEGLKYINNDACYPTIVSLGQIFFFGET